LLSLGAYPEVSLRQAREKRDDLRRQLAAGIDPSAARQAAKAAGTELKQAEYSFPFRQISPHDPNPLHNRFPLEIKQHHASGNRCAQPNQNQGPAEPLIRVKA